MDDGLQVIELLSRHPATAGFLARKLARRLVADDPPGALVDRAAEAFRRSDGDIRTVLRTIIESPEFFAPEFYQAKVKKPLEYVASSLRLLRAETKVTPQVLRYLARMGEPLFLAQPPTGFPDVGSSWVSANMLLTRMNFAADLANNRINGLRVTGQMTDVLSLANLVAPGALSASTRAALAETPGPDGVALLLAAPEFQRR